MEVTQSVAYDENSNPVLRDFLTAVLNETSGTVVISRLTGNEWDIKM